MADTVIIQQSSHDAAQAIDAKNKAREHRDDAAGIRDETAGIRDETAGIRNETAGIRDEAESAAATLLANLGVDENYISYTQALPDSAGATVGTKGAYFKDSKLYQVLEWDGSQWQEIGSPLLTDKYIDEPKEDIDTLKGYFDITGRGGPPLNIEVTGKSVDNVDYKVSTNDLYRAFNPKALAPVGVIWNQNETSSALTVTSKRVPMRGVSWNQDDPAPALTVIEEEL